MADPTFAPLKAVGWDRVRTGVDLRNHVAEPGRDRPQGASRGDVGSVSITLAVKRVRKHRARNKIDGFDRRGSRPATGRIEAATMRVPMPWDFKRTAT